MTEKRKRGLTINPPSASAEVGTVVGANPLANGKKLPVDEPPSSSLIGLDKTALVGRLLASSVTLGGKKEAIRMLYGAEHVNTLVLLCAGLSIDGETKEAIVDVLREKRDLTALRKIDEKLGQTNVDKKLRHLIHTPFTSFNADDIPTGVGEPDDLNETITGDDPPPESQLHEPNGEIVDFSGRVDADGTPTPPSPPLNFAASEGPTQRKPGLVTDAQVVDGGTRDFAETKPELTQMTGRARVRKGGERELGPKPEKEPEIKPRISTPPNVSILQAPVTTRTSSAAGLPAPGTPESFEDGEDTTGRDAQGKSDTDKEGLSRAAALDELRARIAGNDFTNLKQLIEKISQSNGETDLRALASEDGVPPIVVVAINKVFAIQGKSLIDVPNPAAPRGTKIPVHSTEQIGGRGKDLDKVRALTAEPILRDLLPALSEVRASREQGTTDKIIRRVVVGVNALLEAGKYEAAIYLLKELSLVTENSSAIRNAIENIRAGAAPQVRDVRAAGRAVIEPFQALSTFDYKRQAVILTDHVFNRHEDILVNLLAIETNPRVKVVIQEAINAVQWAFIDTHKRVRNPDKIVEYLATRSGRVVSDEVREYAVDALRDLKAVPQLTEFLRHTSGPSRAQVVEALAELVKNFALDQQTELVRTRHATLGDASLTETADGFDLYGTITEGVDPVVRSRVVEIGTILKTEYTRRIELALKEKVPRDQLRYLDKYQTALIRYVRMTRYPANGVSEVRLLRDTLQCARDSDYTVVVAVPMAIEKLASLKDGNELKKLVDQFKKTVIPAASDANRRVLVNALVAKLPDVMSNERLFKQILGVIEANRAIADVEYLERVKGKVNAQLQPLVDETISYLRTGTKPKKGLLAKLFGK